MTALLHAENLCVRFAVAGPAWRRRWLTAVEGVCLELQRGETVGVVGESGCGKTTLGRALLGLVPLHAGRVTLAGEGLDGRTAGSLRALRRQVQMVFQDPQGSLDPRMTVGQSVAEPLQVFEPGLGRLERRRRVEAALQQVGLSPDHADRFPHEFSGGQCQRVGIARATILRPALVVCDEPVSALDVSVQGQVVNLLTRLQRELGLGYVFISHNLAVVRHVSTRVLVMYLGRSMEYAPVEAIFDRPLHPYTRALLDAMPSPQRDAPPPAFALRAELPSPLSPPYGCVFSTRCPLALDRCHARRPEIQQAGPEHFVACHRWREWVGGLAAARPGASGPS